MTEKLFYTTQYDTKFTATVIECTQNKDRYEIILNRTLFYPEGGGQPGDIGFLNEVEIFDTHEHGENVIHYSKNPIEKGTEVNGEINWDYRLDLMQNHTGEHMISGIICEKYNCNNVGFHMGKERITIDFDAKIPDEDLADLELKVNKGIWANVPISVNSYKGEELDAIDYRSKIPLDGYVRIVKAGDFDCCACCGTHVAFAGEVGLIKIVGSQNYKGGTRLEILCGVRAFNHYNMCQESVKKISNTFSAKEDKVFESIEKLINDNSKLQSKVKDLQEGYFLNVSRQIESYLKKDESNVNILILEEELNGKDMALFSKYILNNIGNNNEVAIFSKNDIGNYSFLIASNEVDVKPTFNGIKEKFDCKGGGKPTSVQGSVICGINELTEYLESRNYTLFKSLY